MQITHAGAVLKVLNAQLHAGQRMTDFRDAEILPFSIRLCVCQYRKRGSVGDTQLPVDPMQVDLDGTFGQPKPSRNFLVGYTLGEHDDYLALAGREWVIRTSS